MPISKSAKKSLRQSLKRKARNLIRKKKVKDSLKKIKKLVSQNKVEEAKSFLPSTYKSIDKALKRKIFKKNKAARLKSRVARLVSQKNKSKS